jgi:hypothetical protein
MTARPFAIHTTRHPLLSIASVLALGACADWLADSTARLILWGLA